MASKFQNTKPVIRDMTLEGYEVRVTIDGDGLAFQRKGDRSRDKATVKVKWTDVAEIGAERDPACGGSDFYSHLRLDR